MADHALKRVGRLRSWALPFSLLIAGGIARAEPLTWGMFSLPPAYGGEARMEYQGRDAQVIEFAIHRDWVRRTSYLIVDGVGNSLLESRLSNLTESWTISPQSHTATRTMRFKLELEEPGEIGVSPIGALRPVIVTGVDMEPVTSELGDQGRRLRGTLDEWTVELDIVGRDLVAYRRISPGAKWTEQVAYEDWHDLPTGGRAPRRTVVTSLGPDGATTLRYRHRIVRFDELSGSTPAPTFTVPGGFTVVDHIEGVTKTSDGRILGPMEPGERLASHTGLSGQGSARTGAVSLPRLALGAGALLIAVAGIIALRRRT